jgi:hypothetical protein
VVQDDQFDWDCLGVVVLLHVLLPFFHVSPRYGLLGFLQLLSYDDALTLTHGEPLDVLFLEAVEDEGLCSVEVSLVNGEQVDNEVEVLPDLVILLSVVLKW